MAAGFLLADDGLIDETAVLVAATNARPVALTLTERRLAMIALLAAGIPVGEIARRLHMRKSAALDMARDLCLVWPRPREPTPL